MPPHALNAASRSGRWASFAFGLAAITALPRLAAALGSQAAFFGLAALAGLGLISSRAPCRAQQQPRPIERSPSHRAASASSARPGSGILGVSLFYFGQGEFWPYLEVVGLQSGIARESVDTSLSISSVSALLGSTLVLLTGRRFGYPVPLFASFVLTIGAIASIRSADAFAFRAAICAFTFGWPVFSAYQFAVIARSNPSGRVAALVTAANCVGLCAGPLAAGELLRRGAGGSVQWLSMALDALALASVLPLMRGAGRSAAEASGPLA